MHDDSWAGDPRARSGTWPSLRSERYHPAFVRRMAARLALEALQIEKTARAAAHEVWEEPTRPHRLPGPAAPALSPDNLDGGNAMNNLGFPVSPTLRLADLSTALARQGLCLYWDVARRAVRVMVAPS